MKKAIVDHIRDFVAIGALFVVGAIVSAYILSEQRFQFPLVQEGPYVLQAEMQNALAVTPGQGQTVEVAGVKVGRLGEVKLRNGRAIVALEMFPRFKGLVRQDAKGLLRPRTGLKDMFIDLDPGTDASPAARPGAPIPVAQTLTHVDLDEIISQLDTDTRSYIAAAGRRHGQGPEGPRQRPGRAVRALRPDRARPQACQPRGRQGARGAQGRDPRSCAAHP